MEKVFKEKSKNIRVYIAIETIVDPFEKNVVKNELNPFPLKAIIVDLTTSQAMWKMPGIEIKKAKEIILHRRYRSLIEKSSRIVIDGEDYYGWRDNSGTRLQIREEENYIRLYVYSK